MEQVEVKTSKRWYERLKENVDFLLQSDWFVLFFALFTAFCWLLKIEYSYLFIVELIATYLFFSSKSLKPLLTIFAFFIMGFSGSDTWSYIYLAFYLACGIFFITGLIYRFYMMFLTNTKFNKGKMLAPLLVVFIAMILGGLGCVSYNYKFHIQLIIYILIFAFVYVIATNFIKEDIRSYVCKIFLGASLICVIEMIAWYLGTDNSLSVILNQGLFIGWTDDSGLAMIFTMSVIMMIYKASKHTRFVFYYTAMAGLCSLALFFTLKLNIWLVANISILTAWVFGYVKAIKRKKYLVLSIGVIVTVVCTLIVLFISYSGIIATLKQLSLKDNEYISVYRMAIKIIREQLLFGVGFFGEETNVVGSHLWVIYDTPLQVIFSTGIIGAILFGYYYYSRYKVQTEYFSKYKFFAIVAVLAFDIYGLFENMFLNVPLNLLVLILVISCEKETKLAIKLNVERNILDKRGETNV